ncbi:MAG: hypothetical protein HQL87_09425 [Magnetococcales bacterium]|nr:hypothetical protein [Magnetococcales bacterium]
MDKGEVEAMIVASVTARLPDWVREAVQAGRPALVAQRVQAEIERLQGEGAAVSALAEPVGLEALVREAFVPQVHRIARQVARAQVVQELPEVAERLILAELARL